MFQIQKLSKLALLIAIIACLTFTFSVSAIGQEKLKLVGSSDVKIALFKDVNNKMTAAKNAQADVLAPKNYGEAMKRYKEAESDLKQGKKTGRH
jgi:hypothetical protein